MKKETKQGLKFKEATNPLFYLRSFKERSFKEKMFTLAAALAVNLFLFIFVF